MSTRHSFARSLSLICGLASLSALSACAPGEGISLMGGIDSLRYNTVASFPVINRTGVVRQDRSTGHFEVGVSGTNAHIPLVNYQTATLLNVFTIQSERVALISGSTTDCPLAYTLVGISNGNAHWGRVGRCGEQYGFQSYANNTSILATQTNAADPNLYLYKGGRFYGPKLTSVVNNAVHRNSNPVQRPSYSPQTRYVSSAPSGNSSSTPAPVYTSRYHAPVVNELSTVGSDALPHAVEIKPDTANGSAPKLDLKD